MQRNQQTCQAQAMAANDDEGGIRDVDRTAISQQEHRPPKVRQQGIPNMGISLCATIGEDDDDVDELQLQNLHSFLHREGREEVRGRCRFFLFFLFLLFSCLGGRPLHCRQAASSAEDSGKPSRTHLLSADMRSSITYFRFFSSFSSSFFFSRASLRRVLTAVSSTPSAPRKDDTARRGALAAT